MDPLGMIHETLELRNEATLPERIAKAESLVKCSRFWRSDAEVRMEEDIRPLNHELKRNGRRQAWSAAQDLQRCL